jgi:hypothetical protein
MDDLTDLDRGPYLSKPKVAERFDTTSRTIDRWSEDPELGFPKPLFIRGYQYFSLPDLISWERSRAAEIASDKYDKGAIKQRRKRNSVEATA